MVEVTGSLPSAGFDVGKGWRKRREMLSLLNDKLSVKIISIGNMILAVPA